MNLSQHTLRSYDQQLQNLLKLILDMGHEVREQVVAAREAFRSREESRVANAKEADKHINDLERKIEEEATVVLALQNPLAVDLRFVTSVLKITGMLERCGDYAKNTVKRGIRMGGSAPESVIKKLEQMATVNIEMLDAALEAFEHKDIEKATNVWKRDEEVDTLYHDIFTLMQQNISKDPDSATAFTHIVFAAKNLERLADYTTALARTVYYIASGRRADKSYLRELESTPPTH